MKWSLSPLAAFPSPALKKNQVPISAVGWLPLTPPPSPNPGRIWTTFLTVRDWGTISLLFRNPLVKQNRPGKRPTGYINHPFQFVEWFFFRCIRCAIYATSFYKGHFWVESCRSSVVFFTWWNPHTDSSLFTAPLVLFLCSHFHYILPAVTSITPGKIFYPALPADFQRLFLGFPT